MLKEPQGRTGLAQLPSYPPKSKLPQQFTLHWLWGLPGPCPALVSSPQIIPPSFPACSPTAREEDLWPGRTHTCYPPSCWCSWPQVSIGDKDRRKEPGTGEGRVWVVCKMELYGCEGRTHGLCYQQLTLSCTLSIDTKRSVPEKGAHLLALLWRLGTL